MKVAVVGGGITGLATAFGLSRAGADVQLLEASDRLGGKILTLDVEGRRLDVGADAILARRPEAADLVREVGLAHELIAPATGDVWIWTLGRLRPLPEGTVFGAPGAVRPILRSGVLSAGGVLRAAIEPLLGRAEVNGDESVGEFVTRRFGHQVTEALVDPLLGGVYAGEVYQLSLQAAAAPLAAAASRHRSVMIGARRLRAERQSGEPLFLTVRGGLDRLVDALGDRLGESVRSGETVTALEPRDGGWRVGLVRDALDVDAVVLTVPAPVASALLEPVAPAPADLLASIRYASVAVITLGYDRATLPGVPRGSGMLVPRREGRLVKAVTWTSAKWPHHAHSERFWMRASVGRMGDTAALALADDELARRVDREVRQAMGLTEPAPMRHVTRWTDALPQHEVGHLARVAEIRRGLPAGVMVAGAAYDGVGIAPCVAQANAVVERLTSTG